MYSGVMNAPAPQQQHESLRRPVRVAAQSAFQQSSTEASSTVPTPHTLRPQNQVRQRNNATCLENRSEPSILSFEHAKHRNSMAGDRVASDSNSYTAPLPNYHSQPHTASQHPVVNSRSNTLSSPESTDSVEVLTSDMNEMTLRDTTDKDTCSYAKGTSNNRRRHRNKHVRKNRNDAGRSANFTHDAAASTSSTFDASTEHSEQKQNDVEHQKFESSEKKYFRELKYAYLSGKQFVSGGVMDGSSIVDACKATRLQHEIPPYVEIGDKMQEMYMKWKFVRGARMIKCSAGDKGYEYGQGLGQHNQGRRTPIIVHVRYQFMSIYFCLLVLHFLNVAYCNF